MAEAISGVSSTVRTLKFAYDQRHTIQKFFTRAKAYVDMGKTQIVVTGVPSAGKSFLTAQLHGRARELYFEEPGTSSTVEVDAISFGQWTKLVRVLPGQGGFRAHGESEAFGENDALEGVIHVVDNGFAVPRDAAIAATLTQADGIDTIAKLLEYNKIAELDALKLLLAQIKSQIRRHKRPKWLAIVVNKVDLYPDSRNSALALYHPNGTGAFASALREFRTDVGADNIEIHAIEACADQKHFTWNGETARSSLEPNEQREIMRKLMNEIATISSRH